MQGGGGKPGCGRLWGLYTVHMHTVTLRQNNSGGSYWLSQAQFDALVADGWKPDPHPSGLSFKKDKDANLQLDVPVADEDAAITIAKIEFARVTGQDPNDIGCTCCGPPFSFDTWQDKWEDEEEEVTIEVTVKTAIDPAIVQAAIHEAVAKISGLSVEDVTLA